MKTFYLQDGVPETEKGWREPRVFIDDRLHKNCQTVETTKAASWLGARKNFFEKKDEDTHANR